MADDPKRVMTHEEFAAEMEKRFGNKKEDPKPKEEAKTPSPTKSIFEKIRGAVADTIPGQGYTDKEKEDQKKKEEEEAKKKRPSDTIRGASREPSPSDVIKGN